MFYNKEKENIFMLDFSKEFSFLMYFSVRDKDDNAFIYYYSSIKYTVYGIFRIPYIQLCVRAPAKYIIYKRCCLKTQEN